MARIIGGISKGNVSLSFAVISDITTPSKRAKGMVSDCSALMTDLHNCVQASCLRYVDHLIAQSSMRG